MAFKFVLQACQQNGNHSQNLALCPIFHPKRNICSRSKPYFFYFRNIVAHCTAFNYVSNRNFKCAYKIFIWIKNISCAHRQNFWPRSTEHFKIDYLKLGFIMSYVLWLKKNKICKNYTALVTYERFLHIKMFSRQFEAILEGPHILPERAVHRFFQSCKTITSFWSAIKVECSKTSKASISRFCKFNK